jgi:predicted branched-subunit amino acid permease
MTTLTSAGQLAGIDIMVQPAQYIAMLVSQLTINIRYSFMSVSLSQKVDKNFGGLKRWLLGFFMTDEIFAVASAQNEVSARFFAGLAVVPYIGWTLGTLFGSLLGNVLPETVMNALCLAIYGMFVAIVAPDAKKSLKLSAVVALSVALSCAFEYLPLLSEVSDGIAISVCAVAAAIFGALFFPIKEVCNDAE